MGVLLCCLRVPEQDGESRNVLRTSAFSYPISNNFPLKANNFVVDPARAIISKPGKREVEEDDVCSTCFHEYNEDNPKIVLQCGHIFHLACIYEWMERSTACPFCSKVLFIR
ncbi:hypothetical protein BRARA_G02849 [Brassica rapa]|uniref:RING-type E3 ubiquitin transferase n=1 Tax=Brassica campestris TaxID=3711 RepID=A0A397YQB0_BRACM|nr:hypothetical protein BRARA_G02849 [Brassica rapa]